MTAAGGGEESARVTPGPRCTLVIPCYGEQDRLPPYLGRLRVAAPEVHFVVVDDGSPPEAFRQLAERLGGLPGERVEVHRYEANRGKGFAVEYGLARAGTELVGLLDGDGAIPPEEVARMIRFCLQHPECDMVIGSRVKMLGREVIRRLSRHLAGRVFATFVSLLFDIPVYDSQCGFKIFRRSVLESCRERIRDRRWLWDTELLVLAHARGYRIEEFPVNWTEVGGSKLRIVRDSVRMGWGLLRFRLAGWRR